MKKNILFNLIPLTTICFYNTLGCKISTYVLNNSENEIPMYNFKGFYLVCVFNTEESFSKKIIF